MAGSRARLLVLGGAVLLVAGCSPARMHTAAQTSTGRPRPSVAVTTRPSPTSASISAAGDIVYFADTFWAGAFLVAVGPGPDGAAGVKLLAATPDGGDVRDIGPRIPAQESPDSLFALNRNDLWFTTAADGGGSETLYNSTDAGQTWTAHPAPTHVLAAGSTDQLWFVTTKDGWLADIEPTGPAETLYRTRDGGAHWQQIARFNSPVGLPRLGAVEFEPDDTLGWLGGSPPYAGRLDYTTDQARTWHAANIPSQPGDVIDAPAIFGNDLLVATTRCMNGRTLLLTYASQDNGSHWSLRSQPAVSTGCQQASTVFTSPTNGWSATLNSGHVSVERTTDGARTWTTLTLPHLVSYPPTIIATDTNHAWLLTANSDTNGNEIYSTSDAGTTWHRIDKTLTEH